MSDFLTRLADRCMGAAPELRPRVPALYEPIRDQDGVLAARREPEDVPSTGRPVPAESGSSAASATYPPSPKQVPPSNPPTDLPRPTSRAAAPNSPVAPALRRRHSASDAAMGDAASIVERRQSAPDPAVGVAASMERGQSATDAGLADAAPAELGFGASPEIRHSPRQPRMRPLDSPSPAAPASAPDFEAVSAASAMEQISNHPAPPRVAQRTPEEEPRSPLHAIPPPSFETPPRSSEEAGPSPNVPPAFRPESSTSGNQRSAERDLRLPAIESPVLQPKEVASARAARREHEIATEAVAWLAPKSEPAWTGGSGETRLQPRSTTTSSPTAMRGDASPERSIEVAIGRVEVRAVFPPQSAPPARATPRSKPTLSLDEYLKRGGGPE